MNHPFTKSPKRGSSPSDIDGDIRLGLLHAASRCRSQSQRFIPLPSYAYLRYMSNRLCGGATNALYKARALPAPPSNLPIHNHAETTEPVNHVNNQFDSNKRDLPSIRSHYIPHGHQSTSPLPKSQNKVTSIAPQPSRSPV